MQEEVVDINEFVVLPGEDIVKTQSVKPSVFSSPKEPTLVTDEEEEVEEHLDENGVVKEKEVIDNVVDDPTDPLSPSYNPEAVVEKKKSTKDSLISTVKKFIDEGVLLPFEDEKPIDEYTVKEIEELIKLNFEEKEKQIREKTPQEFFEALPEKAQAVARYAAAGGTDWNSLFKALAQTEEVKSLDVSNEDHQEIIARQYLQGTGFGDSDDIEEQIQEWKEAGLIEKKARSFKPKLDGLQDEIIKSNIAKQEEFKQIQLQQKQEYIENVTTTLKEGKLGDVKIEPKIQQMLYDGLTSVKYQSLSGRPTNLLGKRLEEIQFGKDKDYGLLAEVTWLLSDPQGYKESLRTKAANETNAETFKKLKTEEGNRSKSSVEQDRDEATITRKTGIKRDKPNFFART